MTEELLDELYIKYHRAKREQLETITKNIYLKARDLSTASDTEFCIIVITTCFYFQSSFIANILRMAEYNYKLGGGYESLILGIIYLQERHKESKNEFFERKPEKQAGLIFRRKKLWGWLPIPFTKTTEFVGEYNPYTFSLDLEVVKTEEEIIKHYAELKASLYYYKRVLIKNKWLKGKCYNTLIEGKIDKNKIKDIMMDVITEFQNQAPEIVKFLGAGLASGLFSGVGEDFWKKIKDHFKSEKDKVVIEKFEESPKDIRLQGKLEGLLENKMAEMSQQDLLDLFQLFQKAKADNPTIQTISNSKNVLNNSTIIVGGDFHLGDKTNQ
ncbi:MAG: hypothetical protein QE277_00205 [Flectobacillus sp.]|nr:hypothetical protein [Flectobacillus sp.]